MFYRMAKAYTNPEPPAKWYLQMVVQGYHYFGLTQEDFEESLGVEQLGLTQTALQKSLGVSMEELKYMFFQCHAHLYRLAPSITSDDPLHVDIIRPD